jgi:riboflavin biosynthesis pyrimidine reductase
MTTLLAPPRPEPAQTGAPKRPLQLLFDDGASRGSPARGAGMPADLARRYAGDLLIPLHEGRPTVLANFVETLDGVVALGTGDLSGGGLVSGFHEPDRFVMGLLRSVADAVVVGAGTLRRSRNGFWTPADAQPEFTAAFADWRRSMSLAPLPMTVIVTASGVIPVDHEGLHDPAAPALVVTSPAGRERLLARGIGADVAMEAIGSGDAIDGRAIVDAVARRGARVILTEGGPHLLGAFLDADILEELFLTVAPQLTGRTPDRMTLVEGHALSPADARWQHLVSVRRSGDHLLLRYRRGDGRRHAQEA